MDKEAETIRIATLLAACVIVLSTTALAYTSGGVNRTPPTAPTGYYFDPATSTWYYYDGSTVTAQPPGFEPPSEEQFVFELRSYTQDPNQAGWEIRMEGKFIFSHTVDFQVDSTFYRSGDAFCPSGSQTSTPPCRISGSATTTTYPIGIGPTVLGYINYTNDLSSYKPNNGNAEAWGWLDSTNHDPSAARYHAGNFSWSG